MKNTKYNNQKKKKNPNYTAEEVSHYSINVEQEVHLLPAPSQELDTRALPHWKCKSLAPAFMREKNRAANVGKHWTFLSSKWWQTGENGMKAETIDYIMIFQCHLMKI